MAVATDTITAPATAGESRSETIAFLIMVAVLDRRAACGRLSAVPDAGAVLRAVRLRLQPADRLCRRILSFGHALYFGWASYLRGSLSAKVWGFPPELAILDRHVDGHRPRHRGGGARDPPPGHLLRDGHARARADDVLLRGPGAVHGRRGWHPGGAARQAVRVHRPGTASFNMYVTVLVIFLGGFLFIHRVINSPFGEVLKAIRENEPRAISLGYRTDRYKLVAFVLSAALAGLAGSTKAIVLQIASLTDVGLADVGRGGVDGMVGGLGTVFGPVAGAFFIIAMQTYLAQVGQSVTVIQGVIFVACVLLFRRGIIGGMRAPAEDQALIAADRRGTDAVRQRSRK